MVEGRATKHYNFFVDTFIVYQSLFENSGNLESILNLPYPLYKDIILAQVDEKKREKKKLEEQKNKNTSTQSKQIRKHRNR